MRSALLMPPETRTLTAEEYLLAKMQYEVSCQSLLTELSHPSGEVLIVDARDADAYAKTHIRGALSFPEKTLRSKLAKLPKGKSLIVYGWDGDCELAPKAAMTLARAGFSVRFLTGGLAEWLRRELPIESKN